MVDFNLDKLKKMGSDLVDSVKSGEMLNKVKSSVESVTQSNRKPITLPTEITTRLTEIETQLKALQEAQFVQQKAAQDLCNIVDAFSKDVIAYCESQTK